MRKVYTERSRSGFTLIELIVVMAVLAVIIVSVTVILDPRGAINRANDAKVRSDIHQIATALEAYYTDNRMYPDSLADLTDLKSIPTSPAGDSYNYLLSENCSISSCSSSLSYPLQAPKDLGSLWCWRSQTGQFGEFAVCDP